MHWMQLKVVSEEAAHRLRLGGDQTALPRTLNEEPSELQVVETQLSAVRTSQLGNAGARRTVLLLRILRQTARAHSEGPSTEAAAAGGQQQRSCGKLHEHNARV